ncbi:mechanosensitive ion channel [Candidatus Woesearchaeota archaeon]|nr:mechanosensitive ion channel [Candidatus Woesearchaeota archaeon]
MILVLSFLSSLEEHPFVIASLESLLILLGGFVVGRLLGLVVRRVLRGVGFDKHMRRVTHYRVSLEQKLGLLVSFVVYAVTLILVLGRLDALRVAALALLSLFALILVVSFLLSIKDFFPNLVAGVVLRYRGRVVPGVRVRIKGVDGRVERVSLTSTTVVDGGDRLFLPNRLFLKEEYVVENRLRKR